MDEKFSLDEQVEPIAGALEDSYFAHRRIHHISTRLMPSRDHIYVITKRLFALIFPGFFGRQDVTAHNVGGYLRDELNSLSKQMFRQIYQCFSCRSLEDETVIMNRAKRITVEFFNRLPRVRELLESDAISAYRGDPAAQDTDEIIFSYPTTVAIGTNRLAHELWKLNVPLMPRIMTERAHTLTGVDIHPGAQIGKGFFIDHGTGVVIGETAVIGENCKLYQGVTLGAISFPHDADGLIIRGHKRHPTLEDDVIVYSNASILGNITIGKGATIGGNVFLTRPVPPGSTVSAKPVELRYRNRCADIGRGNVADYQI